MERNANNRKFLRRKYRRYAAAMAGAAFLTGAALPGIPIVKAADVEKPVPPPHAVQTHKTVTDNQNTNFNTVHRERERDRWGNQYQFGHNWGNQHQWGYNQYNNYNQSSGPIEAFRLVADNYGFNSFQDSFTLLNLANGTATIEAIKQDTGQRYLIQLTQNIQGDWNIISVNEAATVAGTPTT
ncbi:MAG: hypothetical protein H6Q74_599 [Firmicutes bacterium]|nr:hypothetical protein [Bacillota bacterium]